MPNRGEPGDRQGSPPTQGEIHIGKAGEGGGDDGGTAATSAQAAASDDLPGEACQGGQVDLAAVQRQEAEAAGRDGGHVRQVDGAAVVLLNVRVVLPRGCWPPPIGDIGQVDEAVRAVGVDRGPAEACRHVPVARGLRKAHPSTVLGQQIGPVERCRAGGDPGRRLAIGAQRCQVRQGESSADRRRARGDG